MPVSLVVPAALPRKPRCNQPAVGIILIFVARFVLKSPFFAIKRESWSPERQEG